MSALDFQSITSVIEADLQAVDALINHQLHSPVALIRQIGEHIIHSGGKRLRPVLHLLAARACGYTHEQHIQVATVVEFLHTATLLHDDVVDSSALRRGKQSAHTLWGNSASVLAGDFLLSRALQMVVGVGDLKILNVIADATNVIAEGEVLQLINQYDASTDEARYFEVIRCKTAKMFEACAQCGAILGNAAPELEQGLTEYALRLGCAFQIADDILDYNGDVETLGKNVGDDLAQGKPTLPLIFALQQVKPEQKQLIAQAIQRGSTEHLPDILDAIQTTGALDQAFTRALKEAEQAVDALLPLPESEHKQALINLAKLAVHRKH